MDHVRSDRRVQAIADLLALVLFIGVLLVLNTCVVGCGPYPVPPPPPEPAGAASCADVCARGIELGCPWGRPTGEGASCETVCENVQSSGVIVWDLSCRAVAPSCEAIDACDG
jgi:hypothetical protein